MWYDVHMTSTKMKPESVLRALSAASDNIARGNYRLSVQVPTPRGAKGWTVSDAQRDVMKAMEQITSGEIDVDTAMALLERPDIKSERVRGMS